MPVCLVDTVLSTGDADALVSIQRSYTMKGYATDQDAATAMLNFDLPVDPTGLVRSSSSTNSLYVPNNSTTDYTGQATWTLSETGGPPADGDEFISGNIFLQTEKQFVPFQRVARVSSTGTTPRDDNLINVTVSQGGDRQADGVDSDVAQADFSIRVRYTKGTVNLSNIEFLLQFAGRPNSEAWRVFAIGQIKFTSAVLDDADAEWDYITYSFSAREGVGAFTVETEFGDGVINVPASEGWDYLNSVNLGYTDCAAGIGDTTMQPHTVFVDKLKEPISYATFPI